MLVRGIFALFRSPEKLTISNPDMARKLLSNSFVLAFLFVGLAMTGCKSVPVDIMSMTAPDSLQTNQNGNFAVDTNADAKQPVAVSWDFGDDASGSGTLQHTFIFYPWHLHGYSYCVEPQREVNGYELGFGCRDESSCSSPDREHPSK